MFIDMHACEAVRNGTGGAAVHLRSSAWGVGVMSMGKRKGCGR